MTKDTDLPRVFDELFGAVTSLVDEYNSSIDVKLDVYSRPPTDFKVRRDLLPNAIALTVTSNLTHPEFRYGSNFIFDVEHWRPASAEADSKAETKKLIPIVEGDGEVRFKYENEEPMSVEETARSLMQPFFE